MTEFGYANLIEEREDNEGGNVKVRLPGVVMGDMAERNTKPEIRVFALQFSPLGKRKIFIIYFYSLCTSFVKIYILINFCYN